MSRNKHVLSTTVSPMTERQLDVLVEKQGLFASKSDAVEKAIGMLYYAANHESLIMCADASGVILAGVN